MAKKTNETGFVVVVGVAAAAVFSSTLYILLFWNTSNDDNSMRHLQNKCERTRQLKGERKAERAKQNLCI